MRQITIDAIRAFRNGNNFKRGNTEVKTYADKEWNKDLNYRELLLHGNVIADMSEDGLYISNGGYVPTLNHWHTTSRSVDNAVGSVTTKERLNGLPNVSIYQFNFKWFLNGEEWDGSRIKV